MGGQNWGEIIESERETTVWGQKDMFSVKIVHVSHLFPKYDEAIKLNIIHEK